MDNKQTVDELLSKIEQCNKKITEINRRTAVEMGRKKEITENLEKMLAQYKEMYGVELSLDNKDKIEEEYQKVVQERAEQAEKMEQVLAFVEQGKYTEVNMMLGLSMSEEESKKAEVKSTLATQASNASSITTRIDIGTDNTEKSQQEVQGFTSIDLSGVNNLVASSETEEEVAEEVVGEPTEEIEEETVEPTEETSTQEQSKSGLAGFSFDNLLGNPSTYSEDTQSESEFSEDGSFFTLPTSQDGTFSNFGNLVAGTRFQPK